MAATIAKVSAAKGKEYYYSKDPLTNPDGNGENLEVFGKLAGALGLEEGSHISEKELSNLLDGKNAKGTVDLVDSSKTEVAAYDLTFGAPKSISVAAANGSEEVKADMKEAHEKGVNAALEYMEKNTSNTRRYTEEGERVTETQGSMIAVKAEHSLARAAEKGAAPDPHLHTHAAIMNVAYDKHDNKFKALSADEMFSNQKMADNIYRSVMAKDLADKGYTMDQKSHGLELKVDQEVLDKFSSRNKSIKDEAEKQGAEDYKDIQNIQHKMKEDKVDYSESDLKQAWNEKLQDIKNEKGESKYENFEDVFSDLKKGENQHTFKNEKEVLEKAAELLTMNESVLKEKDLVKAATDISGGQFTAEDFMKELDNVKKIGQKEPEELKLMAGDKEGAREFTTKDIYNVEKETINTIENQKQFDPLVREDLAKAGVKSFEEKYHPLNDQQKEAVMTKLTSTDQYITEQGLPGVGKTTILKAFNHALNHAEDKMVQDKQMLDKDRIDLETLAPTNAAAKGASQEASIDERQVEGNTFAKFVLDTQKEDLDSGNKDLKTEDLDTKKDSDTNKNVEQDLKKEDLADNKDKEVKSSEKTDNNEDLKSNEALKSDSKANDKEDSKSKELEKNSSVDKGALKKEDTKKEDKGSEFQKEKVGFFNKQSKNESELFVSNGKKIFNEDKSKGWSVDPLNKFNFGKSAHGKVISNKSGNNKKGSVTSKITSGEHKGAKMKESWNNNAHFFNKRTEVKFKDGSSYSTQTKGDNKKGLDAAISSSKSYSVKNSKGDTQTIKKDTVMGVTLDRKSVHNSKGLDQNKIGVSVAGIASISKNKVSAALSNGKTKDINETKIGAIGLSRLSKTEEIKDRNGEVLQRKVTVDKAIFGVSVKREVKIQNKADIEKENSLKTNKTEALKNAVNDLSDTAKAAVSAVKDVMSSKKEDLKESGRTELITNKDSKSNKTLKSDSKDLKADQSKSNESKFDVQVKDTVENKITGEKSEKVIAQGEMTKSSVDKLSKQEAEAPFSKDTNNRGGKVLMPDETSMASSKDLNAFVKEVSRSDSRAIMIGDTEQFKSIGQGKMFNHIQEKTHTIQLTDTMRQKNSSEKNIAENLRDKENQHKAFSELEKNGRFIEEKNIDKRIEKIADIATSVGSAKGKGFDGVEKDKELNYKNTIVVADNKKDIEKINGAIRDKLHDKGVIDKNDSLKAMTKQVKNMSPVKQATADNYEKGDHLVTFKKGQGIKVGEQYKITKVNTEKNTLTLRDKEGEFRTVQANKVAGNVNVIKLDKEREFSKGDQVIVKVTDKKAGVLNSEMGEVKGFDKEKGTLDVQFKGEDKARTLDMKKEIGLDHAYAVTPEASQGGTWDRVVFSASHDRDEGGRGVNKEMAYVAGTRQTHELTVITDNKEEFVKGAGKSQEKTSTLDYKDHEKVENKEDNKSSEKIENKPSEKVEEKSTDNGDKKLDKEANNISEEKDKVKTEANKESSDKNEEKQSQDNQDKVQKEEVRSSTTR